MVLGSESVNNTYIFTRFGRIIMKPNGQLRLRKADSRFKYLLGVFCTEWEQDGTNENADNRPEFLRCHSNGVAIPVTLLPCAAPATPQPMYGEVDSPEFRMTYKPLACCATNHWGFCISATLYRRNKLVSYSLAWVRDSLCFDIHIWILEGLATRHGKEIQPIKGANSVIGHW